MFNVKSLLIASCALMGAFALGSVPAFAQVNKPPPTGAILDLGGGETGTAAQTVNHNSAAPTSESVNFVAGVASTDITFAFREDPAFLHVGNISLIDITHPSANLIVNGTFSAGGAAQVGSESPTGWTFANVFGAFASGVVGTTCGAIGSFCWVDGSVQAYDAIDQFIATTIGDTYTLSFQYYDDGPLTTFSDVSTNGINTGTGGNGIDILAYAQAGLPNACTTNICVNPGPTGVPEPASLALFGAGLIGLGLIRRRRAK